MKRAKSSYGDEDNPLLLSTRGRRNLSPTSPRGFSQEIDRIIDYSKASTHQNVKRNLNSFFENPKADFTLKTVNGILSFVLVAHYIAALYNSDPFETFSWGFVSFLIHLYLFAEYLARLYSSKDPRKYFFSLESRLDLLSNAPFLIVRLATQQPFYDDPDNILLQAADLLSILRLLRLESYQRFIENEVNRQLTNITLTILTLILFASASLQLIQRIHVQYFDPDDPIEKAKVAYPYQFYVFSVVITISTLGYENFFPGAITKVALIILIFISLFIIPTKSSQLISIFSSKSVYARIKYKTTEQTEFIIVTGTVSNASAYDFFNEFFHEDHGSQGRHGILLLPSPPDSAMESMIRNKEFTNSIHYIQGDPLKEVDLKRCQADKASAIIILCNKHSNDANEEDAKTILQAMFIKKFLKHAKAPNVKLCMQILRPEGKTHYYLSLNKQIKSDQVLCVEELKLSLLAKSCLCPGLMALVANLIASSGEPPKRSENDNEWLEEYWHGKGFEVYQVRLAAAFHGHTFAWVAAKIYKNFRAILFGLELGTGDNARMYNNPGDYVLQKGVRITAYVISEDKEIADAISNYKVGPEDLKLSQKFLTKRAGSFLAGKSPRFLTMGNERSLTAYDDKSDGEDDDDDEAEIQFPTKLKQENFNNHLTGEFWNLGESFHLAPSKINLIDVTFKTMENNILATGHIVLCGLVPNLRNFVLPLRAKYLEKYPPIVILHVNPPTEKQWNQVSFFPEIYFVKGSAMNVKDLIRANIQSADKVVILSPEVDEVKHFVGSNEVQNARRAPEPSSKKLTRDQEDLLDAKTIFKYKAIMKIRPDIPIVTELVSPLNLGFLINNAKDYATMKKYGQVNTPLFAAGSIYLSSMIDNLICQAYYNPSLITVLNQLIVGSGGPKHKHSHFDSTNDIRGSNLYHFSVPTAFIGQNFDKIFDYLCKYQNIIPIALYRIDHVKGGKLPFVVTNPDPDTILTEKDIIFILSQSNPPPSSKDWGAPFEEREHFERRESSATTMIKTIAPHKEITANYEEVGRENLRTKKLKDESEMAMRKIEETVSDLKKVREEIETLKKNLEQRQGKILQAFGKIIYPQIAGILPPAGSRDKIVYDDDDMLTASPASSISQ